MESYFDFFVRVTGNLSGPWPFQTRFHESHSAYTALIVPTGLGKTQTVLTDWLYRRPTTRLVWVLPGRALTRQVAKVARRLVERSGGSIKVLELMGESEDLDLTLRPDEPAILVATLDIAVTRALNRGYARSAFRWPIDFGLLNNDTQWVFDEVQLQGDALATSTQLAAFRERFKTFGRTPCVWLSATFDPCWLKTVDFADAAIHEVRIEDDDLKHDAVRKRFHATKELRRAPEECRTPMGLAGLVQREHQPGTLTLIIVNTVARAREVFDELKSLNPVLLHSRFRPADRAEKLERFLDNPTGVVVSTQVIEAGIDIDADLMVTDPAPWASLVQRFGRVNRNGDHLAGRIFWIDRPLLKDRKERKAEEDFAPYEPSEVETAMAKLTDLASVSLDDLGRVMFEADPPYSFVLRIADLLDLFDTTPDVTGNQLDVSRFVRSGKDNDVYFAWRKEPPGKARLDHRELCPVPISEAKRFVEKHPAWVWSHVAKGWEMTDNSSPIYPGMRLLFRSDSGGYTPEVGWHLDSKKRVEDLSASEVTERDAEESFDDDPLTFRKRGWQTLAEHTREVVNEMQRIIQALEGLAIDEHAEVLLRAARKHDWGKAHPVFQTTMRDETHGSDEVWAKSATNRTHKKPFFRHELASALAMLQSGESDLAAYLVAAHHGKIRVNIRSMPGEKPGAGGRIARGIEHGDVLLEAKLEDESMPSLKISLDPSDLGSDDETGSLSWTGRVNALLEKEGPFRIAFLEMLLRSADETASSETEGVR